MSRESSANHTRLLKEALTVLGIKFRDFGRYFRHEQGVALNQRTMQPFRYGLAVGASDIIGITAIEITQDMVGQKIGQFTCYEIKTGDAVQSVEQKNFQKMIETHGGRYQVVRSTKDI